MTRWCPLLLLIALSACGQAGDLYLPDRTPAQDEVSEDASENDDE